MAPYGLFCHYINCKLLRMDAKYATVHSFANYYYNSCSLFSALCGIHLKKKAISFSCLMYGRQCPIQSTINNASNGQSSRVEQCEKSVSYNHIKHKRQSQRREDRLKRLYHFSEWEKQSNRTHNEFFELMIHKEEPRSYARAYTQYLRHDSLKVDRNNEIGNQTPEEQSPKWTEKKTTTTISDRKRKPQYFILIVG